MFTWLSWFVMCAALADFCCSAPVSVEDPLNVTEVQARFLGPFKDFNVIDYAENLMHSKLNLLFALIPRLRPAGYGYPMNGFGYPRPPFAGTAPFLGAPLPSPFVGSAPFIGNQVGAFAGTGFAGAGLPYPAPGSMYPAGSVCLGNFPTGFNGLYNQNCPPGILPVVIEETSRPPTPATPAPAPVQTSSSSNETPALPADEGGGDPEGSRRVKMPRATNLKAEQAKNKL